MNYNTIKYFCTVNGPGVRTAVFVSGCNLHCKGCFNTAAWDFLSGKKLTDDKIDEILDSIEPVYIKGLSILGGEPLDIKNQGGVSHLIEKFRDRFGTTKNIWLWSGYYFDDIPQGKYTEYILDNLDAIVDGPFEAELYDSKLQFRGSSNQHIILRDEIHTKLHKKHTFLNFFGKIFGGFKKK